MWKTDSKPRMSVNSPFGMSVTVFSTPTVRMPLFFKPMIVMNKPMPTVIACFKLSGTATSSICRICVTVRIMKMIPEINTAVSAISGEIGEFVAFEARTVEAKYAFKPHARRKRYREIHEQAPWRS